jgi:hypothetical protein
MIIARPAGGLCNRLRVIAAVRAAAKTSGSRLQVIWSVSGEMVARFDELFEPVPDLDLRPPGRYRFVYSPSSGPKLQRAATRTLNRLLGVSHAFYQHDVAPFLWSKRFDLGGVSPRENVFLSTCESVYNWDAPDFSWVVPQPALRERVAALTASFDADVVGVHIRGTDNEAALRASPRDLFIDAMTARKRARSDARFFLATDDPAIEAAVQRAVGADAVIAAPKRFGRDSVEAIQDAVVDLFALSQTTEILGAMNSSFTETAAAIGRLPFTILRK